MAIVLLVIIFNPFPEKTINTEQSNPDDQVNLDDVAGINIFLASVVNTDEIFTESDNDAITNFLDEVGLDGTEKFGVLTNIAIISPDGTEIDNKSNILGIAQSGTLSIVDEDGKPRDLDTIQTTFLAVTKNTESSINVAGTVEFYLDDTLIKTKRVWASTTNSNNADLSVVDNLTELDNYRFNAPSFSEQEKKNFTFTLSDEGKGWIDKSEHTYRVIFTDVHAFADSENDTKEFHWTGQHIAYQLTLKVDESRHTILDNANKPIAIYKSDSTLQYTGELRTVATISPSISYYGANQPRVAILDSDNKIIYDSIQDSRYGADGRIQGWDSVLGKPNSDTLIFDGLSRDSDYTIRVFDHTLGSPSTDYQYHTKLSQENLGIGCTMDQVPNQTQAWQIRTHGCHSTFGYESPDWIDGKN